MINEDDERSGKPDRRMKLIRDSQASGISRDDPDETAVPMTRAPRVLPDLSHPAVSPSDPTNDGRAGSVAALPPIRIFDRADVKRRLRDIHGNGDDLYDDLGSSQSGNLSSEEQLRSRRLLQLVMDPRGGWRSPLIATPQMIAAIDKLRIIAPQFESVISVAANAAAMSLATQRPLQVPPILLLGPPGIGKTFFGKRLAAALGSAFLPLSMNLTPGFGLLAGLSPAWKGAGPGKIATTLVDSPNAAPVILFDEVEKVVIANSYDRPLDVLHSMWEPENSAGFRDEYFDIAFDASHIISIATANSIEGISPSLLDRLLVLDIKPPTLTQRRAIAMQAYGAAVIKSGGIIDAEPADAVLDLLAASTPRRITRLILLALPMAVADRRTCLAPGDITAAAALLDSAKVKESSGIGFIRLES